MDAERWSALKYTFEQLSELEQSERGERLATLALSDPELCAQLERLLAADESADHPLLGFEAPFSIGIAPSLPGSSDAADDADTPAAPDPFDLSGRTVSHFRVGEVLGAGGMGVVYRAEDLRLGRTVALKFLLPQFSLDAAAKQRFLREARAASALDHPHICTIHEAGASEQGHLFLAMACYEGETLHTRLAREGALPIHEALDLARQMLRALEAAHAAGIVHRDLKPGNLILTSGEVLKILDFGIAKMRGLSLTDGEARPGTVAYASPEQVRGEAADARSDLWSAGVVLYEVLAGRTPFGDGLQLSTVYRILHEEPPDLRALRPALPPALARVVLRLLSKDPAERYASAAEALDALEATTTEPARSLEVRGEPPERAENAARGAGARLHAIPRGAPVAVVAGALLMGALGILGTGDRAGRMLGTLGVGSVDPPLARTLVPVEAARRERTIAVLPFVNLSPDEEDEYFSDGITEEIISTLAKIDELHVTSRTSAMRYKGTTKSAPEIARELGVAHVVEGSVRRAGDRLRITVQLIDPGMDAQLWSESYERELDAGSLFGIQSDIAQRIADALRAEVSPAERQRIARSPTADLAAYDLYLRGRERMRSYTADGYQRAIALFDLALARDPRFALAEAHRGESYGNLWHLTRESRYRDSALASHQQVVRMDPELPEGYRLMGQYHLRNGHVSEALHLNRRALELDAGQPAALGALAEVYQMQGRYDLALPLARRAAALEPTSFRLSWTVFLTYVRLGEFDEAERFIESVLEIERTSQLREHIPAAVLALMRGEREQVALRLAAIRREMRNEPEVAMFLGHYSLYVGELQATREIYERIADMMPEPWDRVFPALAYAYLHTGAQAQAHALLEEAIAQASAQLERGDETYRPHLALARCYAMLGEPDRAIIHLETAFARGWRELYYARIDPRFDTLREDPRFERLLTAIGADLEWQRARVRAAGQH